MNWIVWGFHTYRPFGAYDKSLLDEKIGVRGESNAFVWSVRGVWFKPMDLRYACDTDLMDSPMLSKAVDVADVPDELLQYDAYDW